MYILYCISSILIPTTTKGLKISVLFIWLIGKSKEGGLKEGQLLIRTRLFFKLCFLDESFGCRSLSLVTNFNLLALVLTSDLLNELNFLRLNESSGKVVKEGKDRRKVK